MTALLDLAARLLRLLPAETAHRLTIRSLAIAPVGWIGRRQSEDHILATRVFGLDFPNPIGLAAGFDKNAEAFAHMPEIGCGFAEIGSVTPRPQAGNPRPRLFRLTPDQAIVNRLGFNNDGLEAVAARLRRTKRRGILGANLGKNKDSADAAADYVAGVKALAPLADYLVVNVSSPNTPGLRALQGREPLGGAPGCRRARRGRRPRPPLLLKIAPDLTEADKADIAEVALAGGVDGLIVSNTTIARPPGLAQPRGTGDGRLERPAALRPLDGGAGGYLSADRRQAAADRGRRHRQRRGCLCQDPGRRLAAAALYGAGLSRAGAGGADQAGPGGAAQGRRFHPPRRCGGRRPCNEDSMTVPLLPGIAALADRYDGFILDLWGVLHDGQHPLPGAVDALERLHAAGKRIVILSNAPRRAAAVIRRIAEIGIRPGLYDALLSSGEATWQWLAGDGKRLGRHLYPIMAARDDNMLEGLSVEVVQRVEEADFILNTGVESAADKVEDFEAALVAGVGRGLPMVCANPDLMVIHAREGGDLRRRRGAALRAAGRQGALFRQAASRRSMIPASSFSPPPTAGASWGWAIPCAPISPAPRRPASTACWC